MMDTYIFQKRIIGFVRQQHLIESQNHILVAVSGGPDSVALLHTLVAVQDALEIKLLTVVHFNHRLRGDFSAQDEAFAHDLAGRVGLGFFSGQEDVRAYQAAHGLSLEMAARACRYSFFRKALAETGAQKLALGHTADDQAEELLLRLLRGTGPSGMAGMAARTQQGMIRPLLAVRRSEVLEYLKDLRLDFRQDASNLEPVCQRNALRLEILPLLKKHFHPQITQTLSRHAKLVQEEESYWELQIEATWPKVCLGETKSQASFSSAKLALLHPALLRRVFRRSIEKLTGNVLGFYAVHFELLTEWSFKGRSGKSIQLPHRIRAYQEGDRLIISTEDHFSSKPFCWTIPELGTHDFGLYKLNLSLKNRTSSDLPRASINTAWMDAEKIKWPLTVRSWQPGDRFQPLGLDGSKKLQDFFTDSKIERSRRGRIPLLCDTQKICWIMGYRLDERVRVSPETKQILVAEYHNH